MLRDFTEKILRNCQRMDNLVKNLLLLADLDHSSRLKLRLCDLGVFIENVSYNLLSVHKDVVIETLMSEEFITVQMDPDLFEQAIFNLLENAVKYSPQPAQITLVVEKKESEVVLKVKDKGVGIKLEHLPYIFNRFFRVNNDRSRKLGGAGLGLSIVKSIIEKHQATLEVSSVEGEGTTFEIKLPVPGVNSANC
jgi:signal transduction histidine kinase